MKSSRAYLFFAVAYAALPVLAQVAPSVVGSDYAAPAPITIAPVGLTTIFVHGIGAKILAPVTANSKSLPTKLAGISVVLKQTVDPQGPLPVPLLAVFPVSTCQHREFENCGQIVAINVQIPFE